MTSSTVGRTTPSVRNRGRRAIVWTALVAGVGWILSGAAYGYFTYFESIIPSGLVSLVTSQTVPAVAWHSVMPWTVIIPLASTLTFVALVVIALRIVLPASPDRVAVSDSAPSSADRARMALTFLALWLGIVLASFVTGALWSIGMIVTDLPPVRIAAVVNAFASRLIPAGYWGIVWGWLPALVAVLILRREPARAGPVSEPAPAAPAPAAPAAGSAAEPRSIRQTVISVALVGLTAALAAIVIISAPLSSAANRDVQNAQLPAPAPSVPIVIYGSPDVVAANQPPGDNWCDSDQVVITPGASDSATGHRALSIELVNTSTVTCVLDGYPDVAFNDQGGNAMDPLMVHGGSFSTTDAGRHEITLAPGAAARALLGWNAMSAAGDDRAGTMLVAPYAGSLRQSSTVDLDILSSGAVAVTAWELAPQSF